MTRMLGSGCRRLMWERGSSRVEKEATISSSLLRVLAIADLRPPGARSRHGGRYTRSDGRAQGRKVYQIVIKVGASPEAVPSKVVPSKKLIVPVAVPAPGRSRRRSR